MSDDRLRRQARLAQHGDPEAETRLLSERLRKGEISTETVVLTARLGHGPSRQILPSTKRARDPVELILAQNSPELILAIVAAIVDQIRAEWWRRAEFEQEDEYNAPIIDKVPVLPECFHEMETFAKGPTSTNAFDLFTSMQSAVASVTDYANSDDLEEDEKPENPPQHVVTLGGECAEMCTSIARSICESNPVNLTFVDTNFRAMVVAYSAFLPLTAKSRRVKKSLAAELIAKAAIESILPSR